MNRSVSLKWAEDGLPTLPSGAWVEDKYRLVSAYMQMFSTGMSARWDKRVYIDLYAGPGCSRIRKPERILRGSPLIALSVDKPFDKYILCEADSVNLDALKRRCKGNFPKLLTSFVQGDCNQKIDDILTEVPRHSRSEKVLSFCFVDPFSLSLHFSTIKKLATRFMDFMVLLALDMDARRNIHNYFKPTNKKVEYFLGLSDWRKRWATFMQVDNNFQRFLAHQFEEQTLKLGYLKHSRANTKHISTYDEDLPLYHLAFFSRSRKGYQFWDECLKYSTDQPSFEF